MPTASKREPVRQRVPTKRIAKNAVIFCARGNIRYHLIIKTSDNCAFQMRKSPTPNDVRGAGGVTVVAALTKNGARPTCVEPSRDTTMANTIISKQLLR